MKAKRTVRYRVIGMDCPSCATKIEAAARTVGSVGSAKVSMASQILTLDLDDAPPELADVERAITELGYRLMPMEPRTDKDAFDDDDPPKDLSGISPAYRRALWTVVGLNVGYGAVELGAGFWGGSQALKADALDFFGDGLITLLAVVAMGWKLAWRARAALLEGVFLAALGLGVLVATVYRVFVLQQPDFEVMGVFGAIALVVNVCAALVLVPHRTGDANARAVWLFSRNDAIGNAAVVLAAGVVAWTGQAWPDLLAAAVIAGLFVHSAASIIRDARADLTEPVHTG